MSSTVLHPAGTISYHEPSLPHLLILISFTYLLNVARNIADSLLGAGLLGQVAIGIIYGPVAKILPVAWEETFLALGYLGLVLIVFEGGLTLEPASFLPLLPLSFLSALVGILLPLAFTFALFSSPAYAYPPLQAFTAGSALASTSLGTTFFVLKSAGNGLNATKIAQVLKGAALADDIVALVLLSVIQSLAGGEGGPGGQDLGWTIGRPIVASIAMCVVSPLVICFILKPLFRLRTVQEWVEKGGESIKLLLGVAVLSAYLSIAYYTGTTVLLGAFLAGVTLPLLSPPLPPASSSSSFTVTSPSFVDLYERYIEPLQNYLLVPLFFGSIGFSIPFLQLWRARIVWRGIVYSILMTLGKVLVGLCVVTNDSIFMSSRSGVSTVEDKALNSGIDYPSPPKITLAERSASTPPSTLPSSPLERGRGSFLSETLPAAAFLGLALVARGEIGILVLQVAYNSAESSSSTRVLTTEPYLVSIWAVAICTIVGPIAFARLVRSKWGRRGVLDGRWR